MSAAHGHENHDPHNAHDSHGHGHESGFSLSSVFHKLGGIRNFLEDLLDLSGKRLGEVNLNPVQAVVDVSRIMTHKVTETVHETRHTFANLFAHGGGHGGGH